MRCIVTAGPTYEPLDQVRRLTNFSTGQLGTELANYLAGQGHDVTLLIGQTATWDGERHAGQVLPFGTSAQLRAQLQALAAGGADAVFHSAAVSDFGFGKVWQRSIDGDLQPVQSGKLSSRLDGLLVELVPLPKLITELRSWFNGACLVGWKYEVDGAQGDALTAAEAQLAEAGVHACVANGPAYGSGFGLVTGRGQCAHHANSASLFPALEQFAVHRD